MNRQQEKDIAAFHINHAKDWADTPKFDYAIDNYIKASEILGSTSDELIPALEKLIERLPHFAQCNNTKHTFPVIHAGVLNINQISELKFFNSLKEFKEGLEENAKLMDSFFGLTEGKAMHDILKRNKDIKDIFAEIPTHV